MTAHWIAAVVWFNSVIMTIFAQTAPASNNVEVVTLITQLGLSGVFLWQWRKSESIRESLTAQLLDLSREVFPMVATATTTMENISTTAGKSAEAVHADIQFLREAVTEIKAVAEHTRRAGDST